MSIVLRPQASHPSDLGTKVFHSFKDTLNKTFIQIPVFRKNKDGDMTLRTVVNVTRMKYVLTAHSLDEPVLTPF